MPLHATVSRAVHQEATWSSYFVAFLSLWLFIDLIGRPASCLRRGGSESETEKLQNFKFAGVQASKECTHTYDAIQ